MVRTEPAALVDAIKRGNFKTSGLKPTVGRVWKQYELPNGKGDAYCKADTDCACPPGLNCRCVAGAGCADSRTFLRAIPRT